MPLERLRGEMLPTMMTHEIDNLEQELRKC